MPVVISMLRAVNVGGHNKIKMDNLRILYESLGFRDPQTYVQSGNVVFKTSERDLAKISTRIENAIEKTFQFRQAVIVRDVSELRAVVANNPFAGRDGIDPRKLLVTFLPLDPGQDARDRVLMIKTEPEELRIGARELYIYFPNGMGRPKLSFAAIDRALKTSGTGRNWNTVMKLLEMAESLT